MQRGVQRLEHEERDIQPCDAALFPRLDFARGEHVRANERERCGVARANIFLQRGANRQCRTGVLRNIRERFGVAVHNGLKPLRWNCEKS